MDTNQHIFQLREDFTKGTLNELDVEKTPDAQFAKWMQQAIEAKVLEVQAFNLCTVNKQSKPSSRIVYLREFENNQFYFYTNYQSRKGIEIETNKNVSATFFYPELERQIRIEGTINFASKEKSDAYFNSRPTESKIGAWSSLQSKQINSRNELENSVLQNQKYFENQEITRPHFWGGYVVTANYYEFWQGRKSRLHDRICYELNSKNEWVIARLAP